MDHTGHQSAAMVRVYTRRSDARRSRGRGAALSRGFSNRRPSAWEENPTLSRCGAAIETALGPDKLVAGGRYSIDFAVDVAITKFADHLPLERQVRQMARDGLDVDSSTLWEQTWHLRPTTPTCSTLMSSP